MICLWILSMVACMGTVNSQPEQSSSLVEDYNLFIYLSLLPREDWFRTFSCGHKQRDCHEGCSSPSDLDIPRRGTGCRAVKGSFSERRWTWIRYLRTRGRAYWQSEAARTGSRKWKGCPPLMKDGRLWLIPWVRIQVPRTENSFDLKGADLGPNRNRSLFSKGCISLSEVKGRTRPSMGLETL